jgi:hypothetical protein
MSQFFKPMPTFEGSLHRLFELITTRGIRTGHHSAPVGRLGVARFPHQPARPRERHPARVWQDDEVEEIRQPIA